MVAMDSKDDWSVRLGRQEWARFTYARLEGDSLRLLGCVRRGPQMGALAITRDGQYVQVNGDFVGPLNSSQIRRAVAKAQAVVSKPFTRRLATAQVHTPVVVIKRSRVPPATHIAVSEADTWKN